MSSAAATESAASTDYRRAKREEMSTSASEGAPCLTSLRFNNNPFHSRSLMHSIDPPSGHGTMNSQLPGAASAYLRRPLAT